MVYATALEAATLGFRSSTLLRITKCRYGAIGRHNYLKSSQVRVQISLSVPGPVAQ